MQDMDVGRVLSTHPTSDDERRSAASFATAAVTLSIARGIRSGDVDRSDVSPLLEAASTVAAPLTETRGRIEEVRSLWLREKMGMDDVEADMRSISKDLSPPLSRSLRGLSRGPAPTTPARFPERGAVEL